MTAVLALLLGAAASMYALAGLAMLRRGMPKEAPSWFHPRRVLLLNLAFADQLLLVRRASLACPLLRYRRSPAARLDIPFGSHGLRLDAFTPPTGAPRVVVFLYGGAWGSGNRVLYGLLARTLVERGWTVVIPDYRLHPSARVDDMLADILEALDWAVTYAATLGLPAARLTLLGHSAGAHLGALLLVRAQLRGDRSLLERVERFVGLAGVYDIAAHYRHEHRRGVESVSPMARVMGETPEAFAAASPALVVRSANGAGGPPISLIHGDSDRTVPVASTRAFAEALRAVGWPCAEQLLAGAGHEDLVIDLMRPGRWTEALASL